MVLFFRTSITLPFNRQLRVCSARFRLAEIRTSSNVTARNFRNPCLHVRPAARPPLFRLQYRHRSTGEYSLSISPSPQPDSHFGNVRFPLTVTSALVNPGRTEFPQSLSRRKLQARPNIFWLRGPPAVVILSPLERERERGKE